MKRLLLIFCLGLCLISTFTWAETMKLPKEVSATSFTIPDDWHPAEDGNGIQADSPDKKASIYLETVASEKEMSNVVQQSLVWLTKIQGLEVDAATKLGKDFQTSSGRPWNRISWDAKTNQGEPAVVGFLLTKVGRDKILTITFWILKKDSEKTLETLTKVFDSVRTL